MATRVDEVQAQGEVSHGEVISKSGNATVEVTESVITLLRWRAACKGWLTRVTKQIPHVVSYTSETCNIRSVEFNELSDAISEFDTRL